MQKLTAYGIGEIESEINKLAKFVGESIPIVNKTTNEMIGIISENDVLQAYLDISEEINQIEKH